jgi:hypothetical protein
MAAASCREGGRLGQRMMGVPIRATARFRSSCCGRPESRVSDVVNPPPLGAALRRVCGRAVSWVAYRSSECSRSALSCP